MKSIMSGMKTIIIRCWFLSPAEGVNALWSPVETAIRIVQMWIIRRQTAKERAAAAPAVEVIDPPSTRQMRRHGAVVLAIALASLVNA